MELIVFWSRLAENRLQDIFNYYKSKAGIRTARKIVRGIVDATIGLERFPEKGTIEEYLKDRPQEFRYLLYTNYKIIYLIDLEKQMIVISTVFDTRQNPESLGRI